MYQEICATLAPLAIKTPKIICSIYVLSDNSISCQVDDKFLFSELHCQAYSRL